MRYLFVLFCLFFFVGENEAQTILGVVRDAYSNAQISGADIAIINGRDRIQLSCDDEGRFQSQLINPGRYDIEVSNPGYQSSFIPSVLISNGKSLNLNIVLTPSAFDLETIVIRANDTGSQIDGLKMDVIGIEETERIAANFQDPVRVINSLPGVAQINDQANHLTIRGLSPVYAKWYLEGLEIINPNHLSNAGTISDAPTQAGGGVNMFSSQVLGNTYVSRGSAPVEYSNAISGVVDLHYRNPSLDRLRYSTTLSLLGLEVGAEGPLNEKKTAGWMANYRYSTIGLLTQLGVPVGDEDIRFQDGHIQFFLPLGTQGTLRLFGFWGNNQNNFEGIQNPDEREEEKERYDINFQNTAFGGGFSLRTAWGKNASLNLGSAISSSQSDRIQLEIVDQSRLFNQFNDNTHRIFSNYVERQAKTAGDDQLTLGVQFKSFMDEQLFDGQVGVIDYVAESNVERTQLRPYVSYLMNLNAHFTIDLGFATSYWSNDGGLIPEPSASFQYRAGPNQISLTYQRSSQSLDYVLTEINGVEPQPIEAQTTIGQSLSLGFRQQQTSRKWGVEAFYQFIENAPVYNNTVYASQTFSAFPGANLGFNGEERAYGIELSYAQYLKNNFFFSSNATIFESQIKSEGGLWQSSRFNGQYIFNLSIGKEYEKQTPKHIRRLGISGRLTMLGGLRERSIDLFGSQILGETVYATQGWTEQLGAYVRPDLSIYIFKNKGNRTIRWGLDIQNVASISNDAQMAYDPVLGEVITRTQLGVIPILSWRLGF